MTPRGGTRWAALCLIATAACEPGRELDEEFAALARDHDIAVVADQRILVGGYGGGWVRDVCTSADNEECEDDRLAITEISATGDVRDQRASGAQFAYRGATTPGA